MKKLKTNRIKPPPLPPSKLKPTTWISSSGPLFDKFSDDDIDKLLLDLGLPREDNEAKVEPECECGADKTYRGKAPSHSDWCPKAK